VTIQNNVCFIRKIAHYYPFNAKGGEKRVSISKRASVVMLSFVFLVALVSAVPVEAKEPYRWLVVSDYTGDPEWTGVVTTEDGKQGTFIWDNNNDNYIFLGPAGDKVQKFSGIWWIDWYDGGHIEGVHKGSFTYAIGQFTINGWVTDTSADWAHIDGRKIHTVGIADFVTFHSEAIFQIN
jgi:hypothetical protein